MSWVFGESGTGSWVLGAGGWEAFGQKSEVSGRKSVVAAFEVWWGKSLIGNQTQVIGSQILEPGGRE